MIKPIETSDIIPKTVDFFGGDTPLKRAAEVGGRPYEERPQQLDMARAVAEAFANGQHLCVEAPTGVGKTFAYLIPAIHLARAKGMPAVVSTHTISLQEQILSKDLPVIEALTGMNIKAAIAKGRRNYICLRRLDAAAGAHQDYLPSADLVPEVGKIREWTEHTQDGSLSDLELEPDPALWDTVCCEIGNCLMGKCPFFKQCFLMKARLQLMEADLIVANHALFFIDLAMKMSIEDEAGGILPAYCGVVLDEGHTVQDTAATHMGLRLSSYGLRRILNRLYNNERGRGLLSDLTCTDARMAVIDAHDDAQRFFKRLQSWLEQIETNPLRYTMPGHVPNMLALPLETAEKAVAELAKDEQEEGRKQELKSLVEQLNEYRLGLDSFLNMRQPGHVYWFERQGSMMSTMVMCAVPIEVGPLLHEQLFNGDFTVIVTSATLAVSNRMHYFQSQIGAEEADTLILDSPFDFERQVTLYIPFDMPNPNDTEHFVPAACEHIRKFLLKTGGKAFVLFTSYSMMQDVAVELSEFFEKAELRLLVQGEGLSRSKMLEIFRDDVSSVIFGTASFWMGVDVPGEALSNVIIVRLPFAVPDHPLVAARQETIEARGASSFWEYTIPETVLKFRQGFGRLIRSRDDKGIVVVLDNRIIKTRYGRVFMDSIPQCHVEIF